MSDPGILVTGFPGFIAGRLLDKLLPEHPDAQWFFLVERRFAGDAADRCRAVERDHPGFAGKWHVVEGDIRKKGLGMSDEHLARVREHTRHVWHLAAIYDLKVPQSLAYAVNVDGTIHVLDLCESCDNFESLFYISTCYVAGDRHGRVYEDELDEGQGFKNHYESTKHWAEKHVRHRMDRVPAVVFRPAIVVGDSKTGETIKGDGPYFAMQLMLRLPKAIPMVNMGKSLAPVNLVPVDWLVDAMVAISLDPKAVGKTFQLADHAPYRAHELMQFMSDETGHGKIVADIPWRIIGPFTRRRRVQKLLRIPKQVFIYFNHEVEFDTSNTSTFLKGKLDPCPRFPDYLPALVEYGRNNPSIFDHG